MLCVYERNKMMMMMMKLSVIGVEQREKVIQCRVQHISRVCSIGPD